MNEDKGLRWHMQKELVCLRMKIFLLDQIANIFLGPIQRMTTKSTHSL